jgi:hypothetical protein
VTTTDAGPTVGPSRLPDGREVRNGLALLVLAMSQLMIVSTSAS